MSVQAMKQEPIHRPEERRSAGQSRGRTIKWQLCGPLMFLQVKRSGNLWARSDGAIFMELVLAVGNIWRV